MLVISKNSSSQFPWTKIIILLFLSYIIKVIIYKTICWNVSTGTQYALEIIECSRETRVRELTNLKLTGQFSVSDWPRISWTSNSRKGKSSKTNAAADSSGSRLSAGEQEPVIIPSKMNFRQDTKMKWNFMAFLKGRGGPVRDPRCADPLAATIVDTRSLSYRTTRPTGNSSWILGQWAFPVDPFFRRKHGTFLSWSEISNVNAPKKRLLT